MTPKAETRLYISSKGTIEKNQLTVSFKCDDVIRVSQGQAHYLRSVLRLAEGACVVVFNGVDGEWLAVIESLGKKAGTLRLTEKLREQEQGMDLWLLFAPLKKTTTDLVFQKACELGVAEIHPILTKHSNTERLKVERAELIVQEAAEQCERLDIPKIHKPQKLTDLLNQWPEGRKLYICAEMGHAVSMEKVFSEGRGEKSAIMVGPEGGFALSELEMMSKFPFVTFIGLGPRVLRAETAVMSALSCWQMMCGDWGNRPPHRTLHS